LFLYLLTCVFLFCATFLPTNTPLPGRSCSTLFSDFIEEKIRKT
jgi:hypothetical protein